MNETDTFSKVRDNSNFSTSGTIYLGTENIGYTGKQNVNGTDRFTGLTRGRYAPFKAGTETNQRFAHPHTIVTDDLGIRSEPIVTDEIRVWEGRMVGLWVHRIVDGVWDTRAEARLVFAGRIVGIADELDGSCAITMEDIRADLRDTVLHRNPWTARLEALYYIPEGQ